MNKSKWGLLALALLGFAAQAHATASAWTSGVTLTQFSEDLGTIAVPVFGAVLLMAGIYAGIRLVRRGAK